MHKPILLNRTAMLAIAATVAFSSTSVPAQGALAGDAPVETVATPEPAAPEPAHADHSTDPAPKPSARVKASAPAARGAPVRAETVATVPEPSPLEVPPIAPLISGPIAEPTAATVEPAMPRPNDDLERAVFAGILALLALGGAATAVSSRRRTHAAPERPVMHETARSSPPHPRPASREPIRHAPSAFAWGRNAPAVAPTVNAGGSWVERARHGPTPDNPSLSLKKRMKRAAFYEQRGRAVAAGRARPVVPEAGLPERATENFRLRRTPQSAVTRAFQPA